MTQKVAVTDSRAVTVNSWGDPNGFPILLLHGTPGSSCGPVPRSSVLYRHGIRLICYDRPGYGDSGRHPGRTVADAAGDVLALADEMKLGEFSVVGRSGGGPHALACAATIDSGRLRNVAVLVGLAPTDAPDWFDGMADSNIEEYELVGDDRTAVIADLTERARQVRADPECLLLALEKEMTEYDREIVTDFSFRRLLTESYREALRFGPFGWIDDVLAFRGPWGFALDKISVPVQLWHGQDDVFTPAHHSRWLAAQIPGASIHIQPRAAHFDAMVVLPRILARLKADSMDMAADAEAPELVRL